MGEWSLPESIQMLLLKDRTTRNNIKWGTDNYLSVSALYTPEAEINESYLMSILVWIKSTVEYLSKTERGIS